MGRLIFTKRVLGDHGFPDSDACDEGISRFRGKHS